jgi:Helicase associated domain
MYQRLTKYKAKHGDCNIPSAFPSDPDLANWVANQRHRKKIGSLSADRVRKLDEIGFLWAVYRKNQPVKAVAVERKSVQASVKAVEPGPEEHLYLVSGEYIQYGGVGPRPAKLEKYVRLHGGELPPSIVLPKVPTVFRIGNTDLARVFVRKFKWSGKGPIPADVLEYLNENGVLPPHSEF